jgi:hypothetical protein
MLICKESNNLSNSVSARYQKLKKYSELVSFKYGLSNLSCMRSFHPFFGNFTIPGYAKTKRINSTLETNDLAERKKAFMRKRDSRKCSPVVAPPSPASHTHTRIKDLVSYGRQLAQEKALER